VRLESPGPNFEVLTAAVQNKLSYYYGQSTAFSLSPYFAQDTILTVFPRALPEFRDIKLNKTMASDEEVWKQVRKDYEYVRQHNGVYVLNMDIDKDFLENQIANLKKFLGEIPQTAWMGSFYEITNGIRSRNLLKPKVVGQIQKSNGAFVTDIQLQNYGNKETQVSIKIINGKATKSFDRMPANHSHDSWSKRADRLCRRPVPCCH
jgi:hypothetical protein